MSVAVTATGAFRQVQTHELLSQEQLDEALKLAGNAALAYRPGQLQRSGTLRADQGFT